MIGTIEQAIIDHIKAAEAAGALGYELKTVASYGGELTDDLNRIVHQFPAIWVIYSGEKAGQAFSNTQQADAKYSVIVGAKSLRNEKSARKGSGTGVGSYQMARDMKALLTGETFGLDISPLRFSAILPLFNDRSDKGLASIYKVDFLVEYPETLVDDTAIDGLDDFETFHSNWDVPAHGNVGPEIPDDDNADATDTVTLETEE